MKPSHLLVLTLAILATLTPRSAQAASPRFSWSGQVDAEAGLVVEVHKGDLTIRQSSTDEATVSARLHGRRAEVERIELAAVERRGAVEIIAGYPPRRSRREPITRVRIDVEITVPAGTLVIARTEKGDVFANGLDGPVEASAVLGNIEISTRSWARGRTVNGNVRARIGTADWSGKLAFAAVNGNVEVAVPEGLDSKVRVRTRNGRFVTDLFPVERRSAIPGASLSGQLGRGGSRALVLETVNGNIRLSG